MPQSIKGTTHACIYQHYDDPKKGLNRIAIKQLLMQYEAQYLQMDAVHAAVLYFKKKKAGDSLLRKRWFLSFMSQASRAYVVFTIYVHHDADVWLILHRIQET